MRNDILRWLESAKRGRRGDYSRGRVAALQLVLNEMDRLAGRKRARVLKRRAKAKEAK